MALPRVEAVEPTTTVKKDFHQWALDTAEAIELRRWTGIDWGNVAEELRGLARTEERELRSRLSQLMYHLLKQRYQPQRTSRSWQLSVDFQRQDIAALIEEQPSLKLTLSDPVFWAGAYARAKAFSSSENLPDSVVEQFPEDCPFGSDILH